MPRQISEYTLSDYLNIAYRQKLQLAQEEYRAWYKDWRGVWVKQRQVKSISFDPRRVDDVLTDSDNTDPAVVAGE